MGLSIIYVYIMSIKAGQALCSFPLPRLYESSRQLMQTTISVVFFLALYGLSRLLPLITESSMHCIIVMIVLYPNVKPQLYIRFFC